MKKRILSILLVLVMALSLVPISAFTASAASFAIWWKTNSCSNPNTDFSIEYNSYLVDANSWFWLYKLDETTGEYVLTFDEAGVSICGYIGSGMNFYEYVLLNGSGTYKVKVQVTSGTKYETAPKTFTLNGSLKQPTNLRWDGKIARWDAVDGAIGYYISLLSNANGGFELWSEVYSNDPYYDFSDGTVNECDYKFIVTPVSSDPLKQTPASEYSPVLTVKYERKKITAHMGKVSNNEKKHTLYWEPYSNASGYYIFFAKNKGRDFEFIPNVGGDVGKVIRFDLYDALVKNGAGEYQIAIYAYNGKASNQISESTVVTVTYESCEHRYTKEIIKREYLASAAANCTETTKYYYACESCCEMAPKEDRYTYSTIPGQHVLSEIYSVDDKYHWHECTECGYKGDIAEHTRDANNYCAGCDRTLFDVWVGDLYLTNKNTYEERAKYGSFYYDPYTNKLNVTSLVIDSRCGYELDEDDEWRAMIYAKGNLTLNITGEAHLTEGFDQFAVVVENGDLTVIGDGDFYAKASSIFWTKNGDIHINSSGTLTLEGTHSVFNSDTGSIYLSNATVEAKATSSKMFTTAPVMDGYGAFYARIGDNLDGSNTKEYEPVTDTKYFYVEPAYMVQIRPYKVEGETFLIVVRKGEKYTLPECPYSAPSGEKFFFWGISPLGVGKDPGDTLTLDKNIELMPMWTTLASYTVSFEANGGNGAMENTTATENTPYTLPECTLTAPEGMRFSTWSIGTPDGERKAVGEAIILTETISLYAIWETIPHDHSFGTDFETDATNHWNECACGDKANVAPHADENNDEKCDTCGYDMPVSTEVPDTTPETDNPDTTPEGGNSSATPETENSDTTAKEDDTDATSEEDDNDDTSDESGETKKGLSAGAIVGIVAGSVAVGGVGGFALFWFAIKKKSFADLIAIFKKK